MGQGMGQSCKVTVHNLRAGEGTAPFRVSGLKEGSCRLVSWHRVRG